MNVYPPSYGGEMTFGDRFLIVGHRGLTERFIENSLEGFVAAKTMGLDAVELDIQLTKDKKIVVFHDSDLTRLCGISGKVWDYDYQDLRKLKLQGGTERIPTLSEVLDNIGNLKIFIELKTIDHQSGLVNDGLEAVLAAEILNRDIANYRFLSFNPNTLKNLKKKNGEVITGLNLSKEAINYLTELNVKMLKDYDIDFVQPDYEMFLSGHMSKLEKAGMPVIPWTVNDEKNAMLCKDRGAAGIITDIPLKLMEKIL